MKRRVSIALAMVLALAVGTSVVSGNAGNLVSYWPFDEGTGTTALDATANDNDGTIYGATYSTTDKAPVLGNLYALSFDGNDYVEVPESATLEPANVTVAAWVKATNTGSCRYIIAKGASGCTAASYALYTGGGGGLSFYIFNGSSYKLSPPAGTSVWDGEWHHVAGTFDGAHVRLYVDGSEIGSGASTSIDIGYGLPTSDGFFVGAYRGTCNLHFNGSIDEVRVWSRALTADEIAALVGAVDIDIKPGSYPNSINLGSSGVIPVAILSSAEFDATQVDPCSVELAGSDVAVRGKGKCLGSSQDVNGDGLLDLVVQVETENLDPNSLQDGYAVLKGETYSAVPVEGQDEITIVPPGGECSVCSCTTIHDGTLLRSDNVPIVLGYDEWGYNYQAHMFNGGYCDAYRDAAWCQSYKDVQLIMKWNDAWLSNMDCDGDGSLDRYYGFESYIGSGAWLTNHQWGEYEGADGETCWFTYFVKIIAAPADATLEPDPNFVEGVWYALDGTEIGPAIWGAFAIIQQVENDPCAGIHGLQYSSPDHPGFGGW